MNPINSLFSKISFVLFVVASIVLCVKIVADKANGRAYDANSTPVLAISACWWLSFISRTMQEVWLQWVMLLAQLILVALVMHQSWPALKKITRN